MKTNKDLFDEAGDLLKKIEPLDLADDTVVDGYYEPDLNQVTDAHTDWIERVRFRYPELVRKQEQKPAEKKKENKLIDRINNIKR